MIEKIFLVPLASLSGLLVKTRLDVRGCSEGASGRCKDSFFSFTLQSDGGQSLDLGWLAFEEFSMRISHSL